MLLYFYGGREGSPAAVLKSRVANAQATWQMHKPHGKCKTRVAIAKNEHGCLNLGHAVSRYQVAMEFRFALH